MLLKNILAGMNLCAVGITVDLPNRHRVGNKGGGGGGVLAEFLFIHTSLAG